MVISTFNEGWEERLARLRRCMAERPDGPLWLWAIRIRILEFISARHRKEESAAKGIGELELPVVHGGWSEADQGVEDTTGPALPWHTAPLAASAYAPRTRLVINPVLERLQETNDANRMRLDRNAPPQDVWMWWREAW